MKLTGNQIMYLLTIRQIGANKHIIRSVDVAENMKYSRASIHKMLNTLKSLKLIEQEYYGSIRLTPLGARTANSYLKKYNAIEEILKPVLKLREGYSLGICELIEESGK